MPTKVLDWLAMKLGDATYRRGKKRAYIAKTNLSLCFPDKSDAALSEMVHILYRARARAIFQYPLLWWQPRSLLRERIKITGFDLVEAARNAGKNVIVLLCHSASIDVAVTALALRVKSSGPYKPIKSPLLNWLIAKGRLRFVSTVYSREEGIRPLLRSVRNGEVLIYPADEDFGSTSKCVFAPFFGVPKATIPVLGRMATATGAAVFACISYYDFERSRYVVRVMPEIQGLTGLDRRADAQAMNSAIEDAVKYCPEQYLWTLKLFKSRPIGESPIYSDL